mmetsp:Transcript_23273/g.57771  ORF Transcript_23273/g.57771 Transcript_23273/m.57771 type:complete len:247 (+) Transcript_23273:380-1120(+)
MVGGTRVTSRWTTVPAHEALGNPSSGGCCSRKPPPVSFAMCHVEGGCLRRSARISLRQPGCSRASSSSSSTNPAAIGARGAAWFAATSRKALRNESEEPIEFQHAALLRCMWSPSVPARTSASRCSFRWRNSSGKREGWWLVRSAVSARIPSSYAFQCSQGEPSGWCQKGSRQQLGFAGEQSSACLASISCWQWEERMIERSASLEREPRGERARTHGTRVSVRRPCELRSASSCARRSVLSSQLM